MNQWHQLMLLAQNQWFINNNTKSNMNGTANIEIDLSDGILSRTETLKVVLEFVSDAPTDILLGNESVETFNTNETNSIGSFITNISADDVDNPYGDIHQFELINHVDEYVLIDNNGDLLVNKALDHESLNEFPITIKATDKDSHIFTKDIMITVDDIPEVATDISLILGTSMKHQITQRLFYLQWLM